DDEPRPDDDGGDDPQRCPLPRLIDAPKDRQAASGASRNRREQQEKPRHERARRDEERSEDRGDEALSERHRAGDFEQRIGISFGDAPPVDEPVRERDAESPRPEAEDVGDRGTELRFRNDREAEAHGPQERQKMLEDEHARADEDRVAATAGVRDRERGRGRGGSRYATDPFRRQPNKPSE